MVRKPRGTLIIIGGAEDKEGDAEILQEVVRRAEKKGGGLALLTVATHLPEEVAEDYRKVFGELGLKNIEVIDVRLREDAFNEEHIEKLGKCSVAFFTGGDQLRITSQVGDSPVFRCLEEMYMNGATIVGTSAGAAAMSETMLISGAGDQSADLDSINMAPGLGLLRGAVVDSHFAERGRIGRLVAAVAQNPRNIGIGIDEDTSIIVEKDSSFTVMGSGAVYVADGCNVSYSNLSEKHREGVLAVYNVKLHILAAGNRFDLETREPVIPEGPNEE